MNDIIHDRAKEPIENIGRDLLAFSGLFGMYGGGIPDDSCLEFASGLDDLMKEFNMEEDDE